MRLLPAITLLLFASSAAPAAEKYHPGHYVAISETEAISGIKELDDPALRGVNKRYYWADLEPRKGIYDFSHVKADLDFTARHGKQLVVFITDKSFNPSRNPLPAYLSDYTLPNMRGFTAKRWDPVVVGRFTALVQALAKSFDADPAFEGIAIQESALMISPSVQRAQGYTPEKYRDALITILTESSHAMEHSQMFWYMNHLDGRDDYLADVAAALISSRVVMGGPDILPYRKRLQATYRLYDRFHGKLRLFCSAQDDSYRHDPDDSRNMGNAAATRNLPPPAGGYVPMKEIFQFARDTLHVNYIFWSYKKFPGNPGAFTFDDAMAVIKANPTF
jgi:hypothetical protein